MNRYQELANFAIEQTRKEILSKCDCMDAARKVVSAFIEYLQCPLSEMRWLKFKPNRDYEEVQAIELTPGEDNFYDFGFSVTFRNERNLFVGADMRFGIRKQGTNFILRTEGERTFDAEKQEQLAVLNEDLYESFKKAFTWPEDSPKGPYGFHPRW